MENKNLRITKIGGSNFLIVPSEFCKVYNLINYVYYLEVSRDGKTITYRRMREDEQLNLPTKNEKSN